MNKERARALDRFGTEIVCHKERRRKSRGNRRIVQVYVPVMASTGEFVGRRAGNTICFGVPIISYHNPAQSETA